MSTSTRLRSIFALAGSLALPLTAAAGPLDWTYTSTFHAAGQPDMPFVFGGGGGMGAGGSYEIAARLAGVPSNPGMADVIVGYYSREWFNAAFENPPTRDKNFELNVTLTDIASGQSGTARFTGSADMAYTPESEPHPIAWNLTSSSQQLTLGQNFYDVTLSFGEEDSSGNGAVTAHVSQSPAHAPEPGTLALAGVGLFGIAGWRRWRKG